MSPTQSRPIYTASPKPTVLLVEDDPAVAELERRVLELSGYQIKHASSAAEARALLGEECPALVVLDLCLPDADGLIFCASIKAMADVPIIICTATAEKRERIVGLRLGAEDYIVKPFDLDEFEARIEAVLRRAASPVS